MYEEAESEATIINKLKDNLKGPDLEDYLIKYHRIVNLSVIVILLFILLIRYISRREIDRATVDHISPGVRVGNISLRSFTREIAMEEAERAHRIHILQTKAMVQEMINDHLHEKLKSE